MVPTCLNASGPEGTGALASTAERPYGWGMAVSRDELNRLAQALARLTPEERALVLQQASQADKQDEPTVQFPPTISVGGIWRGGDLSRAELYDDDAS